MFSVYYLLEHVIGQPLNPPMTPGTYAGDLITFDQKEFFDNNADAASMDDTGLYYVPPGCRDGLVIN